jgi:signal peptidase II
MASSDKCTSGLKWLLLSIVLIVIDQVTKAIVVSHLLYGHAVRVLPVLNWDFIYNNGAAFGMLSNQSGWQALFFIAVAVVLSIVMIVWLMRTPASLWLRCLALSLIIAGAVGNLIDRLARHVVVDFVQLHAGPYAFAIFNFADACVSIGVICLLITFYSGYSDASSAGRGG